jgi:hypothetical protein
LKGRGERKRSEEKRGEGKRSKSKQGLGVLRRNQ